MKSDTLDRLVIADTRGGRNGTDPPLSLADWHLAEALNVDFYGATFARRRNGCTALSMTGAPFTGKVSSAFRYVPGTDESLAEMWAFDDAALPLIGRLAGSATWATITPLDALTGNGWDVTTATLNGSFFVAYKSGQPRLHVYTPSTLTVVTALIVAGGGNGGFNDGGGGGGGQVVTATDAIGVGALSVIVGAQGADSSFNGHSALHGANGLNVAAAGGASGSGKAGGAGDAAAAGGGGGGDAAVGTAGGATTGGTGGVGTASSIGGTSVVYGSGGGGGASVTGGTPGTNGGAGGGGANVGASASPGRGGGGGGGGAANLGGAGAAGVVILSYPTGTLTATGGTITTSGGNTIHLFSTGTTAFTVTAITQPVTLRRTGLPAMGVPTAANAGSGAYANVVRYYRTRAIIQLNGITTFRSEPSTSVSFQPDGSHGAARITLGTVPGENETHWEVEAGTDNATFYRIATVAIGTTTYDDSAAVSSYASQTVSASAGTYSLQKSYKFVAADQGRLLGFGSYTATDKQDTIEYSAVVGSLNVDDAERVPLGNTITLDENDSGVPTGLVGPVNGSFYAFKYRQVWKLTPTGVPASPYSKLAISKTIGAVGPHAIKVGEDENGNPALYWMSHRGPYRYGANGLEYIGHNVEDQTQGANNGIALNLAATNMVSHLCWHGDKRQMWCYVATGSNNDPDRILKLSVGHVQSATEQPVPDGWSIDVGPAARCSVLFSNTVGASMSKDLKPYIGLAATNDAMSKCDTGNQDNGANYQAYVITKLCQEALGQLMAVNRVGVIAVASPATLTCTVLNGSGLSSPSDTLDLTASAAGETRVLRAFGGGVQTSSAPWVQFQIGDGSAQNVAWQIDALLAALTAGSAIV